MTNVTVGIGVVTALLHVVAFTIYNRQIFRGDSKPNAVSWFVWMCLATLNSMSFLYTSRDVIVSLRFFTGNVACIITFLLALLKRKFKRPKRDELLVLVMCLVGVVVWRVSDSATAANMVVALTFLLSFVPTYKGVKDDPSNESPLPWVLWAVIDILTVANVILRWRDEPAALVVPIVLTMTHVTIILLSTEKRKRRFSQFVE